MRGRCTPQPQFSAYTSVLLIFTVHVYIPILLQFDQQHKAETRKQRPVRSADVASVELTQKWCVIIHFWCVMVCNHSFFL